jgi:hypothetical protein
MNCGIVLQSPSADSFGDWLTFIGLGGKSEAGTPATVGLDQDNEDTPDAAILAASKKLTYGICLPSVCSAPAVYGGTPNEEFQEHQRSSCNPHNCRMKSGVCIDCAHCQDCCICGANNKSKYHSTNNNNLNPNLPEQAGYNDNNNTLIPPHRLSVRNKQALFADGGAVNHRGATTTTSTGQAYPQQELRKSPSLLSESSDGSACLDAALAAVNNNKKVTTAKTTTRSPSKSKNKNNGSSRHYNMGDDGEYLYLTHRMLEDHSRRSSTDTSTSSIPSNVPSYISFDDNSNNTGSRPRYNMGGDDDDGDDDDNNYNHRAAGSHRRSASGGSSSRKSSNSFSLRLGRNKKNNNNNGEQQKSIKPTFSFGSDRTRGSASTAKRANSYGGSSLSSSSKSFLMDGSIEAVEPKKSSWFRGRWNE